MKLWHLRFQQLTFLLRLKLRGLPSVANPFGGAVIHWTAASIRLTRGHHVSLENRAFRGYFDFDERRKLTDAFGVGAARGKGDYRVAEELIFLFSAHGAGRSRR